ncbi:MAG: adenylate/guanylate cyclase domain-containing protein [Candidatus Margulisiibacteriota bacterium]
MSRTRIGQVANIVTFPGHLLKNEMGRLASLHARSRELAHFYDLGRRISQSCGLPRSLAIQLGESIFKMAAANGFNLRGASLEGPPEEILASIKLLIPPEGKKEHLSIELLTELRVIHAGGRSFGQKISSAYDQFVPILRLDALDTLIEAERGKEDKLTRLKAEISSIKQRQKDLLSKARDEIHYQGLGNQAYLEIMSAIYQESPGNGLQESITELFDVVTKWAYQVIGRSPDSEAAGWLVIGPDGQVGMPYRFMVPGDNLGESSVVRLKRNNGQLSLPSGETKIGVTDERGRYLTIDEWENWGKKVREDLVVVEKKNGERNLFRRVIRPGSELIRHVVEGTAVGFLGGLAGGLTKLLGEKNALVDLETIEFAEAGLVPGEIIPVIADGTRIVLVSAGSADPNLREEKMRKGSMIEELSDRGGQPIGIVNQDLGQAIGNVRTSAVVPIRLMIEDAKKFARRPQNEFLLKIVGVASYYITSIFKYNEMGEAICLGSLEVTNPDIVPEEKEMTEEEKNRLDDQFRAGQAFAKLISTGIMIKVLQEERDNLTRQYVGEKIFALLKSRDYQALRGRVIDGATIVFGDVSGFTALSDILKDLPEEVVRLLSHLFARLDPVITRHGGIVDKHIGDCIMGDFGVPRREPLDVEEAVAAAVDLQLELQRLNRDPAIQAIYKQYGIPPLGMTIGLHTGRVIAGNVGHASSKVEYTVIGDAVNQAARLQHAASRGQIIIGEQTYRLLSEENKAKMIADFNAYNRALDSPEGKAYLRKILAEQGTEPSERLIGQVLSEYQKLYREAAEEDMFVPCTIYAKNKGVLPGYFVRWDRHAYRYHYLEQAMEGEGVVVQERPRFENQPLGPEAVHRLWLGESDDRQVELFETYLDLKDRQKANLRKS